MIGKLPSCYLSEAPQRSSGLPNEAPKGYLIVILSEAPKARSRRISAKRENNATR